MKSLSRKTVAVGLGLSAVMLGTLLFAACSMLGGGEDKNAGDFEKDFGLSSRTLSSQGRSDYFILEPGYQLILENKKEKLVFSVLNETKKVGGVETRIVEERETNDGELVEVSRNYFAIDTRTKDLFYFGEDVDMYKNGKVTSHEGSWLADGIKNQAGILIPGKPVVGKKYYQEVAPGVALDRAEIVSVTETLETPAGKFTNCVKTEETSGLESGKEYKIYAPGIGLIKDSDLVLTHYGRDK
ncbi:MAG: hypothetical protein NTX50_21410 [Candidatus Sumerlaeota bacterium]|nr:hypothetical protein [Candidatus Sumerlaeota bacterium]